MSRQALSEIIRTAVLDIHNKCGQVRRTPHITDLRKECKALLEQLDTLLTTGAAAASSPDHGQGAASNVTSPDQSRHGDDDHVADRDVAPQQDSTAQHAAVADHAVLSVDAADEEQTAAQHTTSISGVDSPHTGERDGGAAMHTAQHAAGAETDTARMERQHDAAPAMSDSHIEPDAAAAPRAAAASADERLEDVALDAEPAAQLSVTDTDHAAAAMHAPVAVGDAFADVVEDDEAVNLRGMAAFSDVPLDADVDADHHHADADRMVVQQRETEGPEGPDAAACAAFETSVIEHGLNDVIPPQHGADSMGGVGAHDAVDKQHAQQKVHVALAVQQNDSSEPFSEKTRLMLNIEASDEAGSSSTAALSPAHERQSQNVHASDQEHRAFLSDAAGHTADTQPIAQQLSRNGSAASDTLITGPGPVAEGVEDTHDSQLTAAANGFSPALPADRGSHMMTADSEPAGHQKVVLNNVAGKAVMRVLRMTMQTKRSSLQLPALECSQKLIAHGYIVGVVTEIAAQKRTDKDVNSAEEPNASQHDAPKDPSTLPLAAQALDLFLYSDDVNDYDVELAVLRGLLTAVVARNFIVHGHALMAACRFILNIYNNSRNEVNQNIARATIVQIVTFVFQRLEARTVHVQADTVNLRGLSTLSSAQQSDVAAAQGLLESVVGPARSPSIKERGPAAAQHAGMISRSVHAPGHTAAGSIDLPASRSAPQSPQSRAELPFSPKTPPPRLQLHIGAPAVADGESALPLNYDVMRQLQVDAWRLFRALVKTFVSPTPVYPVSSNDPNGIKQRLLVGELVLIVLDRSGPEFARIDKCMAIIPGELLPGMLHFNSEPALTGITCAMFVSAVQRFRHEFKNWMGLLFNQILLKGFLVIDDSEAGGAAAIPQPQGEVDMRVKLIELQQLQKICNDGQLLVDLFVNYDCDAKHSGDMFSPLFSSLVSTARNLAPTSDTMTAAEKQEQSMRLDALRCLVVLLQALLRWYEEHEERDEQFDDAATHRHAATTVADSDTDSLIRAAVADDSMHGHALSVNGDHHSMADMSEPPSSPTSPDRNAGSNSAGDLKSQREFKQNFRHAVNTFNSKPKKGIQAMQQQGLIEPGVDGIVDFLLTTDGLDKRAIGEFLGEPDDWCLKAMHRFTDSFHFAGLDLDDALRKFLQAFRLPGEAQKIDRILEKFGARYCECNAEVFSSADTVYTLSYAIIMLNTDAHNPMVKSKMTKEGFLKNVRGIDNGQDLPRPFLEAIYDRIVTNEIKMRDEVLRENLSSQPQHGKGSKDLLGNIVGAIMGRRNQHDHAASQERFENLKAFLSERAQHAEFYTSSDPLTVRPMVDMLWQAVLATLSCLFEMLTDAEGDFVATDLCLQGFYAMVCLTSLLGMTMERDTFINALVRFTELHEPRRMHVKNVLAFRCLLRISEKVGNYLHEQWLNVLRCVSMFEYLYSLQSKAPNDAQLFAPDRGSKMAPLAPIKLLRSAWLRNKLDVDGGHEKAASEHGSSHGDNGAPRVGGKIDGLPRPGVLAQIDMQDINRIFVKSSKLDTNAIVLFVRALCEVGQEELEPWETPRVFSLTKIVEIAHFNMDRIRIVWSRIWSVLSDFFYKTGCHRNLHVAMYAVDSLRQLAMKFLEREEQSNYNFQNEFLKPFVVVMRTSSAIEIRELIIRCVSQMVLARYANVKSGWKSMFSVFTAAASDKSTQIVKLAFPTIERIVRQHFDYITATDPSTFTDCVKCLVAFTNNPHDSHVALSAIAFLRFCAEKLAAGEIGDMNDLPEGVEPPQGSVTRIMLRGEHSAELSGRYNDGGANAADASRTPSAEPSQPGTERFTDRKEHIYFWFPLLFGLSEMTFDPRRDIRYGALEILFDTLNEHGQRFSLSFWDRILDKVLLPIFDHVREEVTDATTFFADDKRDEADAWLYETCERCLQHLVDIYARFFNILHLLVPRLLSLLHNLMCRKHQTLASVGVAGLVRFVTSAGGAFTTEGQWLSAVSVLHDAACETLPQVQELLPPPPRAGDEAMTSSASADVPPVTASNSLVSTLAAMLPRAHTNPVVFGSARVASGSPAASGTSSASGSPTKRGKKGDAAPQAGGRRWSLREGAGARRLSELRCRRQVQLVFVQACGQIYTLFSTHLSAATITLILDTLEAIANHAAAVDKDVPLRKQIAMQQATDGVAEARMLADPPLLKLEGDACKQYLTVLVHLHTSASTDLRHACQIEDRLIKLCSTVLQRFDPKLSNPEIVPDRAGSAAGQPGSYNKVIIGKTPDGTPVTIMSLKAEYTAHATLVVGALQALLALPEQGFRKHLKLFFPVLTRLIRCEYAPAAVQDVLSELFESRVGALLGELIPPLVQDNEES